MLQRLVSARFFAALFFIFSAQSFGFSVAPVHLEMATFGRDARASVTAVNHRGSRIGVDITIVEVSLADDGTVKELGSGEEQFLVFPPQTFIEPYGKQVFRLQWAGDPEIDTSRTFMVTVTEVPAAIRQTEQDRTQASVAIALAFAVVVNVRPVEGEPEISVVSVRIPESATSTDGEEEIPKIIAQFRNDSNVHGVLSRSQLTITLADESGRELLRRRYDAQAIKNNIGIGLLPANKSRTLSIPLPGVSLELFGQTASAKVSVQLDKR